MEAAKQEYIVLYQNMMYTSTTLKKMIFFSRYKSDLGHWRRFSDHSDFKSYLSLYKSDHGHWRSGHSHFENYLSH